MFQSLARLVFRRRRLVLAAAGVLAVTAALWGTGVFGSLGGAGFEDPDSESARAAEQAAQTFGRHQADVVVVVVVAAAATPMGWPASSRYRTVAHVEINWVRHREIGGTCGDVTFGITAFGDGQETPRLLYLGVCH